MSDIFTTVTHLINSPPGQLVAGGVLAGIVWKFFERVEAVLNDDTKLEIAIWLVGRKKFGPKVQPWPETFARLFDRVFGTRHLSWKCFWRCCLASYVVFIIAVIIAITLSADRSPWNIGVVRVLAVFLIVLFTNAIPDYLSLLETRYILRLMLLYKTLKVHAILLFTDLLLTVYFGCIGAIFLSACQQQFVLQSVLGSVSITPSVGDQVLHAATHPIETIRAGIAGDIRIVTDVFMSHPNPPSAQPTVALYGGDLKIGRPIIVASCVTSIWLWLYAGSGFLLKAARRFDIGFDWFNRKFDIEKKPLQSIGLVAGALVAVVYWATVIVSRVVG